MGRANREGKKRREEEEEEEEEKKKKEESSQGMELWIFVWKLLWVWILYGSHGILRFCMVSILSLNLGFDRIAS